MATGLPDYFSRVFSEMLLQFTDLQDTPGSYEDEANKNVRVNQAESGLEFGGAYFDAGLDANKGEPGRKGRVWWASNSKILYYDDGTDWVEILRSEAVSRLASLIDHAHDSLSSVTSDQHHAQKHEAEHEPGGGDIINVAGLSGLLADPQTPIVKSKFSANKNSINQSDIVSGVWTKVTFTTEEYDVGSKYDAANSKWVPGVVGQVHIDARVYFATAADQDLMVIGIWKNGDTDKGQIYRCSGDFSQSLGMSADLNVTAVGDYFEIYVQQNSGSDKIVSGIPPFTFFTGHVLV